MKWLVGALMLLVSCSVTTTGEDSTFTLVDGDISGPASISAGPASLEVANAGDFNHTLVVTDGSGDVLGATDVLEPGSTASIEINLASGQYLVSCRLVTQDPEGNIIDHYELGMYQMLEVHE